MTLVDAPSSSQTYVSLSARAVQLVAPGSFRRDALKTFKQGFAAMNPAVCRELDTVMNDIPAAIRAGSIASIVEREFDSGLSRHVDAYIGSQFESSRAVGRAEPHIAGEFRTVAIEACRNALRVTCADLDAIALDMLAVWQSEGLIQITDSDLQQAESRYFETRMNLYPSRNPSEPKGQFFGHRDKGAIGFVYQSAPGLTLGEGDNPIIAPAKRLIAIRASEIPGVPKQGGVPIVGGMFHASVVAPNVERDVFVHITAPDPALVLERALAIGAERAHQL